MAEIQLEDITKRFADGTEAVKNVSFTIRDGEFFILVGPSGCGKSTLLNMIVGLEQISEGRLLLNGRCINDLDPKDRDMAMVFQSYAIYPHMTVRQNMAFPLKMAKRSKAEIERRVEEVARILELTELLDRKPANLSGGQRQRVAMGRAMVRKPEAFLLDEPLSNLDARLRVQMRTEIARLHKQLGTTMMYVTHDQTEAMTLGERIAVLNRGEVQQIGTPRDLYERPANRFVAGFIGSPTMNFLPATIENGRLQLPMVELELPDCFRKHRPPIQGPVTAGIRPEHLLSTPPRDKSSPSFRLPVELVEWLGANLFVHLPLSVDRRLPHETQLPEIGQSFKFYLIARLDASIQVNKSQPIELWLAPDKLHLFDVHTGARLIASA
ncbi:MAG: sn-glycerol-3-phosphate ABC transporter ATP-binding protein UgpC [Methylohalobius crimeensis]